MNISVPSLSEWQLSKLPTLNTTEKIYSFLDNKRLFDLGVDLQDLEKERPMLKNLIYAPLEKPWLSSGVILGGAGVLILIICGFKGKLSCCKRVSYQEPEAAKEAQKKKLKRPALIISSPVLQNSLELAKTLNNEEKENKSFVIAKQLSQTKTNHWEKQDVVLDMEMVGEEPEYLEPREVLQKTDDQIGTLDEAIHNKGMIGKESVAIPNAESCKKNETLPNEGYRWPCRIF